MSLKIKILLNIENLEPFSIQKEKEILLYLSKTLMCFQGET